MGTYQGKKISAEKVQEIMFDMMCSFADFCDAHEIRYYLCGGTLLGAIRHQDFIPWDDDVDILVPRPDYDRFVALMQTHSLGPHYSVSNMESGIFHLPFTKILDLRTKVIYDGVVPSVWIDIFPMDGLPQNERICRRFLTTAKYLKYCRFYSEAEIRVQIRSPKTWLLFLICLFSKAFGTRFWLRCQDRFAHRYAFDESEYVGGVTTSMGPCERMRKADYVPAVEVWFHGRTFHAPQCWDAYLTGLYGDYRKLPPAGERERHFELAVWVTQEEET